MFEDLFSLNHDTVSSIYSMSGYVLLFISLALLVAITILSVLIFKFKREYVDTYKKGLIGFVVGYALSVIALMLTLKMFKILTDPDVDFVSYAPVFYSVLSTILVSLVGGISVFVASIFSNKAAKITKIIVLVLVLISVIVLVVLVSLYYKSVESYYNASNVGLIVSAVVLIALLIAMYFISPKRDFSDTKSIVYGAISIALSFALSYISFFKMPQGGSITLASLLPLMFYACMFGTRRGIIVCLIYGTLQAVQDPWIIHPMQFMLDYTIAFGMVGLSGIFLERGLFKKRKFVGFLLGGIVAVLLRYVSHVCSGVFAFSEYAPGTNIGATLIYSFTYNSFCLVDMLISLVLGCTLFASKRISKQLGLYKTEEVKYINEEDEEVQV